MFFQISYRTKSLVLKYKFIETLHKLVYEHRYYGYLVRHEYVVDLLEEMPRSYVFHYSLYSWLIILYLIIDTPTYNPITPLLFIVILPSKGRNTEKRCEVHFFLSLTMTSSCNKLNLLPLILVADIPCKVSYVMFSLTFFEWHSDFITHINDSQ